MSNLKFTCFCCKEEIAGRHVVDGNLHYCDDACADKDWRDRRADQYAYEMSDGVFTDFNDYMRDQGATIVEDWEMPQREE